MKTGPEQSSSPIRLLAYQPALDIISHSPLLSHVELVRMRPDGRLCIGDTSITILEADPRFAWLSPDLFIEGLAPAFLRYALEAPALRWLQSGAAGTDNPAFSQLTRAGVRITTNDGPAVSIAEYVLAGVLDLFQRGPERRAMREAKQWGAIPFREISTSRWLIIGFGAIGSQLGLRLRAMGADVTGVRRQVGPSLAADRIVPLSALEEFLPRSDVVVLALPATPQTRDLANADFFSRMKFKSILVNVGRGNAIDEAALIAALQIGRPAHAILDVFRHEPLPPDSPLWGVNAVTITPHVAGMGSGLMRRSADLFLYNLEQILNGGCLKNELLHHDELPELRN